MVELVAESADKTCNWNQETGPCGKENQVIDYI